MASGTKSTGASSVRFGPCGASRGGVVTRLRALTPDEQALDRARQSLLSLGLEIDALAEGRSADVSEMRLACERLERDLAALAGCPSAHDLTNVPFGRRWPASRRTERWLLRVSAATRTKRAVNSRGAL